RDSLRRMGDKPTKALVNIDIDAETIEATGKEVSRLGAFLFPRRAVKSAKARAEANLIATQNEIEMAEMRQRASYRLQAEAIVEQHNLESIAARAHLLLTDGASSENVDDDWMANIRDKVRLVSNEQMQGLWSRVLAGEINQPGTFSRRTVNAIDD